MTGNAAGNSLPSIGSSGALRRGQPRPIAAVRRLRVILLEPFQLLRESIQAALSSSEDLEIAVEPSGSPDSLTRLRHPPPDVVLMGADLVEADGVESVRRVVQVFAGVPVVVLAHDASPASLLAAVRAGASGHVLGSLAGTALPSAIRAAAHGWFVIDPVVARRLPEQITPPLPINGWRGPPRVDPSALRSLSRREAEVLQLLAQGMRNKEIAAALHLSLGTVKTHLRHAYRRLGSPDRVSATLAVLGVRSAGPVIQRQADDLKTG